MKGGWMTGGGVTGARPRLFGGSRDAGGSELAEVAATAQRLAVLLGAGVAPASAWSHLAELSPVAAEVARLVEGGETPTDALVAAVDSAWSAGSAGVARSAGVAGSAGSARAAPPGGDPWRGLAAAWTVATDAGAPLAPALRGFASSLRSLAQTQREIEVALAGPRATMKVVLLLPVVAVLFGVALGFDTIRVLVGSPLGVACLAVGLLLLLLARRWTGRMVAAARPASVTPGLALDLMAIAMTGGASLARTRSVVADAVSRFGIDDEAGAVDAVLGLSVRAGVPAAELLRSDAEERRLEASSAARERAAALSVRLMLPLGGCVLPAFLLLGVGPLLISVISATVREF